MDEKNESSYEKRSKNYVMDVEIVSCSDLEKCSKDVDIN